MKIFTHSNYCLFDTLSQIPVKICNAENIHKYKTSKSNLSNTWIRNRQNIEYNKTNNIT